MEAVWLVAQNGGLFPTCEQGRDFLASLSTPDVKAELTPATARSIQEHNLFFKVISSAYEADEAYKEKYINDEQLRAHLLIKAGHCESDDYEAEDYESALLLVDTLKVHHAKHRAKGKYAICKVEQKDGKFFASFVTPKSLKMTGKNAVGQHTFHSVVTRVFDIIQHETEISVDDLKRAWDELRRKYGKRISA